MFTEVPTPSAFRPGLDAGLTDDPYGGRRSFYSTEQPGYYPYNHDHADIPPMLTPLNNAPLTGSVRVVRATVEVGEPLPRSAGDDPVTVSWNVEPAETVLAPVSDAVMIEIWDPTPPGVGGRTYRKKWAKTAVSGAFQWNGLLDEFLDPDDSRAMGRISMGSITGEATCCLTVRAVRREEVCLGV